MTGLREAKVQYKLLFTRRLNGIMFSFFVCSQHRLLLQALEMPSSTVVLHYISPS